MTSSPFTFQFNKRNLFSWRDSLENNFFGNINSKENVFLILSISVMLSMQNADYIRFHLTNFNGNLIYFLIQFGKQKKNLFTEKKTIAGEINIVYVS